MQLHQHRLLVPPMLKMTNNKAVGCLGVIFVIYSLVQIIVLSILCGLDDTLYSGQHHFLGFIQSHGLELFLYFACISFLGGIILIVLSANVMEKKMK